MDSGRLRLVGFLLALAFVLLPILSVRIPPSGDLPQQLHQIVLAERVDQGLEPELDVEWLAPNRLGYLPLAIAHAVAGPRESGRVALALVALLWVGAIHLFAARAGIDVASATLANAFLFNRLLYGGFLNFLCGIAGMLLWLRELERDERDGPETRADSPLRLAAGAFVATLLLSAAHALWLVAGGAIVVTVALLRRFDGRRLLYRALGALPVVAHVLYWSAEFGGAGWQAGMKWAIPPLDRVRSLPAFAELVLGGLRGGIGGIGGIEPVVVLVALAFVLFGLVQAVRARRAGGRSGLRIPLFVAGLACLVAAIVLPTQLDLTVFLDARWAPFAMVFLILTVPLPPVRPALLRALAGATLAALSLTTTAAWLRFERVALDGFDAAIAAIPEGAKVIGMDVEAPDGSIPLRWHPYEHLVAWAGVERGAYPSMSFVELESSLVTLRDPAQRPAWLPFREHDLIRLAILPNYDFALVRGGPDRVATLRASAPPTRVVTQSAKWALLEIGKP